MWRYEFAVSGRCRLLQPAPAPTTGEATVAHDKIPPLTHHEMSALARRFEARAASVLLRDQPQLQSDMWLAARLIHEWTGRAGTDQSEATPVARAGVDDRALRP
jgi:hypothetical protein